MKNDTKIVMFDKPIIKKNEEVKKGDIISTEYGDYGNWVQVVVDHLEISPEWVEVVGHYANNNEAFTGYHTNREKNKVIGHVYF